MDCRGLEFVDFQADVSIIVNLLSALSFLHNHRESGRPRVLRPPHVSRRLISWRVSGMIMMRRLARLASRRSPGLLAVDSEVSEQVAEWDGEDGVA